MIISRVEIYQSRIALREPFVISLGSLDHAENLLVVLHTRSGLSGFGECSPFMTIHGESMETCFTVAHYLGKALLGANALDIARCSSILDTVIYGNTSVKSAFDMALYDLASRHAGQPLYRYLGATSVKPMFTDYTVSFNTPEKMASDAHKIREEGFTVIKVKLGGDANSDLERIRRIREAVGMEIPLRIDANQGWDTPTAIDLLNRLSGFHIQHCEEPIPRWNFVDLPLIRSKSPIPVMADESCLDHHDARRLLSMHACDRLNVKLGKSSGIFKALKIVRLAAQHGIQLQMGGFLESRLGFTAAAHLAQVSDDFLYFDFDTPLMFAEDPVIHGITYGPQGRIALPADIGLGAEFDEAYLRGLKKSVIT